MKHICSPRARLHALILVLVLALLAGGCIVKAKGQHEVGVEKVSRS